MYLKEEEVALLELVVVVVILVEWFYKCVCEVGGPV